MKRQHFRHMGLMWEAMPQMKSVYCPQQVCPSVAHVWPISACFEKKPFKLVLKLVKLSFASPALPNQTIIYFCVHRVYTSYQCLKCAILFPNI